MGELEVADQVRGLQQAAREVDYLDQKRVAIVGWSYGKVASLSPPPHTHPLSLPTYRWLHGSDGTGKRASSVQGDHYRCPALYALL